MEAGGMLADRYRLVAPIARGAQGTVWRAVDTRAAGGSAESGGTGNAGVPGASRASGAEEVAVKVSGDADVESLLRLVCEQSVRIGHPHVLTPLDWFVRADEAWLVLPLVRGGTLAGLLADYGELPGPVGLLIAEQLLDALTAVHASGLVHRDVKPSNVLLAATGEGRPHAYLGDFGVARVLPHLQLTSPGFVTGTPDYLAPEVRAGGPSAPAQDVYAAGLVLRDLGAPTALVTAMTDPRPEARPTAAAARDALARARRARGPERWPVIWADEPFTVPDQFPDLAAPAPPGDAPGTTTTGSPGLRRRVRPVSTAAVAAGLALAAALTLSLTTADGDTGTPTPPPTPLPSDAVRGLPDPDGPTPFTPCTADEALSVGFSPEGYALLCAHLPGTRAYEWRPAP
ncbi:MULTISPECIES: serine/threonine-protein kinase [Streptomyces]|uniref:non-specific serine/threonine protein kinase n=2 Tax=Streptomyces TaxID=1883 RepID=A0ABU4KFU0_9ACTN|nr:serine/threonine-protein kinase [Streptomyces roseolus]MDX2296662.1 serine/threonine-protein kinase [Streptomyces roseolus]